MRDDRVYASCPANRQIAGKQNHRAERDYRGRQSQGPQGNGAQESRYYTRIGNRTTNEFSSASAPDRLPILVWEMRSGERDIARLPQMNAHEAILMR